jgi:hypothetical protein
VVERNRVELQKIGRIISRSTGTLRLDPLEASSLQIEPVNESIDKPDNVVRPHIVVHSVRQKQELGPIAA